jgi:protoporphyrinogen IX oxidase
MTWFHTGWLGGGRISLRAQHPHGRTYRLMNEVPTILMLVIVFAVIVKF